MEPPGKGARRGVVPARPGADSLALDIDQTIGRYRVLEKLGQGGMGVVYVAEDTDLRRKIALKVLSGGKALDPELLQRFQREARALATLNHTNIVTIYSVEHEDDLHFLTMELVEGEPLDRIVPEDGVGLEQFFEIAIPLATALAAAHKHGITHRDLKPANVMRSKDGTIKVLDFGLAKLRRESDSLEGSLLPSAALTQTGMIMGTIPYMSPEQTEGNALDHRSDIFSLGIIFYEMATGSRPFQGASSASLIASVLKESPRPVTDLRPNIPPRLAQIIARCLEKNPDERYQNAATVAKELSALKEAVEHHPRLSTSLTRLSALVPRTRRTRLGLALSGVAAVVLITLALNFATLSERFAGPPATPKIASLAVLPLTNLSGDEEQEYLADGMTEILITELSKIGALKVISRTSVMRFKETEQPLAQIADELGVDAVVEGSVLRSEDRVRVTAQLIHAASDEHLWAESFERDLRDLLVLQGEVARAIAQQVEVTLTPEEQARLASGKTVDPSASEAYLRGRNYWSSFNFPAAAKAFQEAIDLDPDFARAWAGLAHARQMQGVISFPHPPRVSYALAKDAVTRALELDDDLAEAHAVKGSIALNFDFDWELAHREFQRAIELNPGERHGHTGLAYYFAAMGRFEEALAAAELARELDPLSPMPNLTVCETLYYARQYDRALFQLGEHWDGSFAPNHWLQDRLLQALGDPEAAAWSAFRQWQGLPQPLLESLEEALTSSGPADFWREMIEYLLAWPKEAIHAKVVAENYTRIGETEKAFEWLEQAYERRDPLKDLGVDPIWDPIRPDPRFNELLIRLKLPQAAEPQPSS